jgi:hypothetical protein
MITFIKQDSDSAIEPYLVYSYTGGSIFVKKEKEKYRLR